MTGRGNYNKIDYEVRQKRTVYPIRTETDCLDIKELSKLHEEIGDFIETLTKTNIIIEYADGTRLFEINKAICEEINYGLDDFDAVIQVSIKHQLPLHDVFLAYNLRKEYKSHYERYALSMVVKILHELGFKNIQIYRKLPILSMRRIAEIIKAWDDGNYLLPNFLAPIENKTKQLQQIKN